jgi:hypothetical protein
VSDAHPVTPQSLNDWADKIDNRLGPISGRDADLLAVTLREAAIQWQTAPRWFSMDGAPRDGTYIKVLSRLENLDGLDAGKMVRRQVYWCDEAAQWACNGNTLSSYDVAAMAGWMFEEIAP